MKLTRIFAGISAAAVAAMAMAITSFAGTASYSTTITLDSSAEDTKMVQITYADLGIPADAEAITNISFDCAWDCTAAYWAGGGGAVGIQANTEDTGWVQIDMANVPEDYTVTTWSESIDFDPAGQDIAGAYADGFVQFGWWWGADPSVEISNITVTYTGGSASEETTTTTVAVTTTVAEEETTTAAEEETTTVAEEETTTAAETTTTAAETTTTAATTTAAAGSAATGVEGVASVVALLTIAGAAVVVTKKN